jgi:hypothetical protein
MKQEPVKHVDLMAALVAKIGPLLAAEITGAKVGVTAPKNANKFVVLRRDGGRNVNQIVDASFISALIYTNDYGTAEELANVTTWAFQKVADGDPVVMVDTITTLQDVSDETGQRRFIRFEVHHRGVTY